MIKELVKEQKNLLNDVDFWSCNEMPSTSIIPELFLIKIMPRLGKPYQINNIELETRSRCIAIRFEREFVEKHKLKRGQRLKVGYKSIKRKLTIAVLKYLGTNDKRTKKGLFRLSPSGPEALGFKYTVYKDNIKRIIDNYHNLPAFNSHLYITKSMLETYHDKVNNILGIAITLPKDSTIITDKEISFA